MNLQANGRKADANPEKSSIIYWLSYGVMFLFLFFMPYQRALFNGASSEFDVDIFFSQLITWTLLLLFSVSLFYNVRKRGNDFIVYLFLLFPPLAYTISHVLGVSDYYSGASLWINVQYSTIFLVGMYLSRPHWGAGLLEKTFLLSGSAIVLFGFANWFGDASFWGLFRWTNENPTLYRDAVMFTENGYRLTSAFQYANSYAAYLIALMIGALLVTVLSNKRAWTIFSSLLLVPAALSFVLTLSRGGFIVLPFVIILVLPLLSLKKQIISIILLIVTSIASFSIVQPVTRLGTELQAQFIALEATKGWLFLLAASIVVMVISLSIRKFLEPKLDVVLQRLHERRSSRIYLPVLGVVAGMIGVYLLFGNSGFSSLLPENIGDRIENINLNQHSVLERGTFYQNAVSLWKDYPAFGAGGGAWQSLYEKYQSNPYVSRQAHNFFLQTLVEVGIVGLITVLILFLGVVYFFLRSHFKKNEEEQGTYLIFYVIVVSILAHSFIDFNMSYVYLGALVYLSLGAMVSGSDLPSFPVQKKLAESKWAFFLPSALLVSSLLFIVLSFNDLSGNRLYESARANASSGTGTLQEILNPLDMAINKTGHPEYVDLKLALMNQLYSQTKDENFAEQAEKLLSEMKQKEPFYKPFVFRELQLQLLKGKYEDGIALLEASIPHYPWDMSLYEQLAAVHFQYGVTLLNAQSVTEAQAHWDAVFAVRDRVEDKAKELEHLPEAQLQGRAFGITPGLALSMGQVYLYRGDDAQAEQYLATALDKTFDQQEDFTAAIYYLGLLKKQGRTDHELLSELLMRVQDPQQINQQIDDISKQAPIN
ncbi:hypothetical protein FE782_11555 [Paenibacillus antri]|uniref:O-antigen ligase-related domain-containing protein n=1 Tax=Paenibacillus antri TaxID=2582848 RepID=A0A5R9GA73_9BACL|nr:O-antigen ligase family protein [Paenibacillus antri]TLS52009.1 hypothetical protein FE782_11555 [Paenibacillus antri]